MLGFTGYKPEVQGMQRRNHGAHVEAVADQGSSSSAESMAEVRISGELEEASSERRMIAGAYEETGFLIEANFAGAIAVVGDNGFACGEGLGKSTGQTFAAGEVSDDVHDPDESGHLLRGNKAGEDEMSSETQAGSEGLKASTPWAVAHQQELDPGASGDYGWSDREEVIVAF